MLKMIMYIAGLYRYYNDCFNQITDLEIENINTIITKINTVITTFENQFKNIVFIGDGSSVYENLLKESIVFQMLKIMKET